MACRISENRAKSVGTKTAIDDMSPATLTRTESEGCALAAIEGLSTSAIGCPLVTAPFLVAGNINQGVVQ